MAELVGIGPAADEPFVLDEAPAPTPEVETLPEEGEAPDPAGARAPPDGRGGLSLRNTGGGTLRTRAAGDVREEHYEELHFHRLTGGDMRAIAAAEPGSRGVVAIARSARVREGLMQRLYDRMDGADAIAASQVVAHFLGTGQTTGR
jgi:hypothetical protein